MQRTATHHNTRQHTATQCNTLQRTATHCNTMQHTATHCNALQHTATHIKTGLLQVSNKLGSAMVLWERHTHVTHGNESRLLSTSHVTHVNTKLLQVSNTLQHAATHCNTLQHATHCNTGLLQVSITLGSAMVPWERHAFVFAGCPTRNFEWYV